MRKLRIARKVYRTKFEGSMLLQERRWWGWKTIDEEEIPSYALIARACFGDWGGWKCKFWELGRIGEDGIITPKET